MYLTRTVAPTNSIVSLTEVKTQLRITFDDDDTLLTGYIALAQEYLEGFSFTGGHMQGGYLNRALLTQTLQYCLDDFPEWRDLRADYPVGVWAPLTTGQAINLPMPPLQSVTSVSYINQAAQTITLDPSAYIVETQTLQGRIILPQQQYWPSDVALQQDAVTIVYVAGYGADESYLPVAVKQAAMMLIGQFYMSRAGGQDVKSGFGFALDALLRQHQMPRF